MEMRQSWSFFFIPWMQGTCWWSAAKDIATGWL